MDDIACGLFILLKTRLACPLSFRCQSRPGVGHFNQALLGHSCQAPKCAHALRATAATNALDHNADIAKVQEWLGHANISTTRIYDTAKTRPEDSPTFKVKYG